MVEILWMAHEDNIAYLTQHAPSRMRKYLTERMDFAMLAAWDRQQMKDKSEGGE